MVLLSGHGEQLPGERVCPAPAAAKEMPGAGAESSPEQGAAEAAAEEPDEEEEEEKEVVEEEDCEEYEDFSELPDTCSIASDDSFYPPRGLDDDDDDIWSLEGDERDSPEALSLFRACCTNNSIVLKALIRQGPQEEEVREADRNRRVSTEHPAPRPRRPGSPAPCPGQRGSAAAASAPSAERSRAGAAAVPGLSAAPPACRDAALHPRGGRDPRQRGAQMGVTCQPWFSAFG